MARSSQIDPDALEHRGGPAGVDDGVRIALELDGEQLGDEAVMPDGAVVGGDAGVAQQR